MSTTKVKSRSKKVEIVVDNALFQENITKNPKIGEMMVATLNGLNQKILSASEGRIVMVVSEPRDKGKRLNYASLSTSKGAMWIEAKRGYVLGVLTKAGAKIRQVKAK